MATHDDVTSAVGRPARDRNDMVVLDHHECLRLLASVPIARVALAFNGVPVVFPVNFVLHHDEIIIRSAEGPSSMPLSTAPSWPSRPISTTRPTTVAGAS